MMTSGDPVRLSATLGKTSRLGSALKAARATGPTAQQLEGLQQKVLGAIAANAVATGTIVARSTSAARGTTVLSAGSTKLMIVLLGAVAVGGAATSIGMRSRSVEGPLRSSPAADSARRAPAIAPMVVATQAAPELAPAPEPKSKLAVRPRPHALSSSEKAGEDEEIPLLQRAHHALLDNPALALALANQHTRRFPASSLDQERELIAIQALVALDRTTEARHDADQFAKHHPGSAYLGRIQAAVAKANASHNDD